MNLLAYVHLRGIHGSTGAGRVARQMMEHLLARGEDRIHILADRADHATVVPKVGTPWDALPYHLFDRDTSQQQARWVFFHQPVAESFWPEAEVIYCTSESYVPTRRARLAVTLHDAAFFEPDAHRTYALAHWKQRLKWSYLFRVLAARADLFHTVSAFSAERLGHYFPALKGRLRVVPNGIPPRFFQPVSPAGEFALAALGLVDRPFVLLPRGLHYRKNADLVLEVWPRLRKLRPDLLLVVSSHCDPDYAVRARALGGDALRLTGFVDDETLRSLYGAARAVWFPSRYEGFGIPVLEAMACRTPVVASDNSSLPEVAGDAALLVPTLDTDAHLNALDSLLGDSMTRTGFVNRGQRRAAGYTWERSASLLRKELASLV